MDLVDLTHQNSTAHITGNMWLKAKKTFMRLILSTSSFYRQHMQIKLASDEKLINELV